MTSPKVIRDPVHNLISFEPPDRDLIVDLIDRPEFQRLRRIRQLGLALFAFPGAEHSRWVHSLGVCHVAKRMVDCLLGKLQRENAGRTELQALRRPIICAALLHDVGHGPFSHVFERALPEPRAGGQRRLKHEDWSVRIIEDRFSEVLREHDVDPEQVTSLIRKTDRSLPLAKDFIDSQLDADRMDYLLRDSYETGTGYGTFDLEWLLHSLSIGEVTTVSSPEPTMRLCFSAKKATSAVEQYILARQRMYISVYTHHTTRAYEALLQNIFGLLARLIADDKLTSDPTCPTALRAALRGAALSVEQYLELDDFRLLTYFADLARSRRNEQLASMCKSLCNREQPYAYVPINSEQDLLRCHDAERELRGGALDFCCRVDQFEDLPYKHVQYQARSPNEEIDEEAADRAIFLINDREQTFPVERQSNLFRLLAFNKESANRFYYDRTNKALLQELQKRNIIKNEQATEGHHA